MDGHNLLRPVISTSKIDPLKSPEIIHTSDGSHTLYLEHLDETYHSRHGAVQESMHVFIEMGLKRIDKPAIRILEIGFGTGLNALLTAKHADRPVHYVSLEPFPLGPDVYQSLNYAADRHDQSLFYALHEAPWGRPMQVNEHLTLEKHATGLMDFKTQDVDLVYYDAFGPNAQPELWELSVFEHLATMLKTGAMLVTYCAKGQVRRNLQAAGFEIERLEGPPGKREMLRGMLA